jgi:hypothetical protein
MAGTGNNGDPTYQEFKRDIPLDDRGINEKKAVESIQAALAEVLPHPAKVVGMVFGIMVEDDAMILTPNDRPANNFLILVGSVQAQIALVRVLMKRLAEMCQEQETEDV